MSLPPLITDILVQPCVFTIFFKISYFLSTDPASDQDQAQVIPVVPTMVPPQTPQIP